MEMPPTITGAREPPYKAALAAVTAGQAEHSQKPWRLRCDVATDAGLRSLAEDGGSLLEQLLDANTHVKAPAPAEETEALAAREAPVAPAKEELAFAEGGAAPEPGPEPEVPEAAAAPPRQPAAGVPRSPCRGGLQALPALLPGVPARLPPLAADLGSVGPAAPTRTLQPLPQQEQPQRPQPLQPQQRQQPLRTWGTPAAHPEQQPPQQQPPEQAAQPEVMEEQLEPELQGSPAIEPVTPTESSHSRTASSAARSGMPPGGRRRRPRRAGPRSARGSRRRWSLSGRRSACGRTPRSPRCRRQESSRASATRSSRRPTWKRATLTLLRAAGPQRHTRPTSPCTLWSDSSSSSGSIQN
ncbi:unnamed protein product [Prorocentrum cordatum]|uniref:Uncharacterized protein n=1 Tax=Prorocentrum cordatum TaxID=2364126 RepID=A0ABN9P9V8_9DINO|nr:unnamed protein product [Polarella glacialis]